MRETQIKGLTLDISISKVSLKGSDYERLSGRLNGDSEVTKWLNLSANVNVTYESRRNLDENNSYTATVFSTLAATPITPVFLL